MRTETRPPPVERTRAGARCVAGRSVAALAPAALALVLATIAAAPSAASLASSMASLVPAASVPAGPATSMQLLGQTPWVGPSGMTTSLAVHTALPASSLALNLVLYHNLETRSGFEESLGGPAAMGSVVLASQTMPLAALATRPIPGGFQVRVHLSVTPGFASATAPVTTLSLGGCAVGQCDGVYPLQVQLLDLRLDERLLAGFTTYLVYAANEQDTIPLDVGLVLPVGTQLALDPGGAADLSQQRMDELETMLGVLESHPLVPVDLDLHAQLALALDHDHGRLAHAVLTRLRVVARQSAPNGSALHELASTPFAPTDVTALAGAGLGADVGTQLARGAEVAQSVLGVTALGSTFVAGGPLDEPALRALAGAGIDELVLPAADLAASPTDATFAGKLDLEPPVGAPRQLSATGLASGASAARAGSGVDGAGAASTESATGQAAATSGSASFTAFASDPGLTPFFDTTTADPVLAAQQLLAEIALIFFEAPDATVQRAVVVAPPNWNAGADFASTLLDGLTPQPGEPQPLARATALSTLFALPRAAAYSPASAPLVPGRSVAPGDLRWLVERARHAVRVLDSIVPSEASTHVPLTDAILLSETSSLSPVTRSAYLAVAPSAVRAEGGSLHIGGTGQITLTSATGNIPISIASSAGTALVVVVRLSSSSGLTSLSPPQRVSVRGNKQVTVRVGVRTSGVFQLRVELTSPLGGVVLQSKQFKVLSTFFSPVAIALSIGALLVLGVWWFRSSRRRRRARAALPPGDGLVGGQPPAGDGPAGTTSPPPAVPAV